jgi:hypothetical protein
MAVFYTGLQGLRPKEGLKLPSSAEEGSIPFLPVPRNVRDTMAGTLK